MVLMMDALARMGPYVVMSRFFYKTVFTAFTWEGLVSSVPKKAFNGNWWGMRT